MRYYGIDEVGFPDPLDEKGWDEVDDYCVANVTPLMGVYVPLNSLAALRLREPVAKIGWSMYVYDLRKPKAAARVSKRHPGALRLVYAYGPLSCLLARMRGEEPVLRLM